jgi:DNA-directed RNA polymerase subunit alpha
MSILAFQVPEKVSMEKADDFHGLFTFKPLEPGFGTTIGNALRRILFSSFGRLCHHRNQDTWSTS